MAVWRASVSCGRVKQKARRETLAAGKLGLLDINNVRRDLVESQLTYLNAIAEAVEARAVLERSIGRSLEGNP